MSKIKKLLKIGILVVLFIIISFIIALVIFSILDKYNLFNNISKMITTILFTIVGVWFVQFLINKIYYFDEDLNS
jgi:membrane protease YdiL (CAAX protease family)